MGKTCQRWRADAQMQHKEALDGARQLPCRLQALVQCAGEQERTAQGSCEHAEHCCSCSLQSLVAALLAGSSFCHVGFRDTATSTGADCPCGELWKHQVRNLAEAHVDSLLSL